MGGVAVGCVVMFVILNPSHSSAHLTWSLPKSGGTRSACSIASLTIHGIFMFALRCSDRRWERGCVCLVSSPSSSLSFSRSDPATQREKVAMMGRAADGFAHGLVVAFDQLLSILTCSFFALTRCE